MNQALLKNLWYVASLSEEIRPSAMKKVILFNEPILLFRDKENKLHAMKDICPHRGIPLSFGKIVDDKVECPYHGWKFSGDGVCREIPSLCPGQDLDCTKIKVKTYPLLEQQGIVWIFIGEKGFDPALAPRPPGLEGLPANARPKLVTIEKFKCHLDHAAIGLMDPAHGPFVHKSWLWRSQKSISEKVKKFGPVPFGFQMRQHKPSANSKAYKILGGEITTEITFTLPSVRIEHIRVGRRHLYAFTGLTPITDNETRIHQLMYWDLSWLVILKPFLKWFTGYFLGQDIRAVELQQEGLKYDPSLMLIRDADTQAKWYYALKDEWVKHQVEAREFQHPVKETELRWRS